MLKKLKNCFMQAKEDLAQSYIVMDQVIKPYLFLFDSNIYTTSRHFNYKHSKEDNVKSWGDDDWFVHITYHPGSLLTIQTGYLYLNFGHERKNYDDIPDRNKLKMAFANVMKRRKIDIKDRTRYTVRNIDILRGV